MVEAIKPVREARGGEHGSAFCGKSQDHLQKSSGRDRMLVRIPCHGHGTVLSSTRYNRRPDDAAVFELNGAVRGVT